MTSIGEPNKWAQLDFPPQLRIGIKRLAEDCDWRIRTDRDGTLFVATAERYNDARPNLVRLIKVVDAATADATAPYRVFDRWHRQDAYASEDMLRQILQLPEVKAPESAVDVWLAFRLQFMAMPDADVPGYMREVFRLAVQQATRPTLWAIEVDEAFRKRVAAVRALFSAQETPEVLDRPVNEGGEGPRFLSARGLSQSWSFGHNIFFEPVLLAASPWLGGLSSYRAGGSAIILLGSPQNGFLGRQAVEGLDLFRVHAIVRGREVVNAPDYPPDAYEDALAWWVARMNDLFGKVLDIGRYVDAEGRYQPAAHLGVLLSLERLFASTQTILVEARRTELVRLSMLFDVIDLLEGLDFGSWEALLHPTRVERELAQLEKVLPSTARDYLLTRVRPAVAALRSIEKGFVLRERVSDGQLRLRQRDGKGWQDTPLATAVPKYLGIARNSTHSFRRMARDPHDVSLLAAHDGDIPDAVSDLGFFHLLRFLQSPRLPNR